MIQSRTGIGKSRPVSDKAYEALYRAIVRCELAPGSWIKAAELSELLGVGRTPTIQALMRLEGAGFTRPVKRKGWQVTPITLQSVHDVFEAFRLVAPGMATLACENATEEQMQTLREMTVAWAPGDADPEAESDLSMRPISYLVEMCGNPVFLEMGHGMTAHFERVANFGLQHSHFTDTGFTRWRDAFHEALLQRDKKRARESLVKVIDTSEAEIIRVLKNTESIRAVPIEIERVS